MSEAQLREKRCLVRGDGVKDHWRFQKPTLSSCCARANEHGRLPRGWCSLPCLAGMPSDLDCLLGLGKLLAQTVAMQAEQAFGVASAWVTVEQFPHPYRSIVQIWRGSAAEWQYEGVMVASEDQRLRNVQMLWSELW